MNAPPKRTRAEKYIRKPRKSSSSRNVVVSRWFDTEDGNDTYIRKMLGEQSCISWIVAISEIKGIQAVKQEEDLTDL